MTTKQTSGVQKKKILKIIFMLFMLVYTVLKHLRSNCNTIPKKCRIDSKAKLKNYNTTPAIHISQRNEYYHSAEKRDV